MGTWPTQPGYYWAHLLPENLPPELMVVRVVTDMLGVTKYYVPGIIEELPTTLRVKFGARLQPDPDMAILGFAGSRHYLSNFYPADVTYAFETYSSVEHAYQAAKTTDLNARRDIQQTKEAWGAKKKGKQIELRDGWEKMKEVIMLDLLRQKFRQPRFRDLLQQTGDRYIEETNHWGDTYWGVCRGNGRNRLGMLLMQVRSEIEKGEL